MDFKVNNNYKLENGDGDIHYVDISDKTHLKADTKIPPDVEWLSDGLKITNVRNIDFY